MFKGARREVVTNEIKDDPLGSFDDKFGRVRNNTNTLQKPSTKQGE